MYLYKTVGVVGSAAILLAASVAFANEEVTIDAQVTGAVTTKPIEMRTRPVATTTRAEIKNTVRENTEGARTEAKLKVQTLREEAKQKIETAREAAKERMKSQREKAKQRLSDIRDKAKQQMAERIANQFDTLNKKWTDHFIQQLEHYSDVLLKIEERANIASTSGKDIQATTAAIVSAKTSIETARTAVIAQAAKTYVLNTASVTTTVATTTASGQDQLMKGLRTEFQNLHKALFKDLTLLRDGVMKNARTAVQSALQTLSQIPGVDDDDNDSTDDSN